VRAADRAEGRHERGLFHTRGDTAGTEGDRGPSKGLRRNAHPSAVALS
jgi:hypothetical protein